MTPESWERIERIFHEALERAPADRAAFLDEACGGDDEVRREVVELLAHDDSGDAFIESPALAVAAERLAGSLAGADGAPGDASDSLRTGQVIRNFRVLGKLGRGGMGEVYLAEDTRLGRRVAIKRLPDDALSDSTARQRFLREARATSALNHPNIVTLYEIDDVDGSDFIVMEYVEGETLRERLARGPLPLDEVVDLGGQVADAVATAHACGILHRDLKPANVIVTPAGRVKVLDFGLAKRIVPKTGDAASATDLTSAGVLVGTVAYMSPEQVLGEPLDARSDVFSLGSVLYEAATGVRPFSGPGSVMLLHRIATSDPTAPSTVRPGLPPEFDALVARALAKDPASRFSSASELAEALRALAVAAAGGWLAWRSARVARARESIPRIEELSRAERYPEAYALAVEAEAYLSDDPDLARLMPLVSDELSVATEPPGARVFLKRLPRGGPGRAPEREFVGTTPIDALRIARDEYVVEVEKDGYAPFRRTLSSAFDRVERAILDPSALRREVKLVESGSGAPSLTLDAHAPTRVDVRLVPAAEAPDRMVFVPGGEYRLVGFAKPTAATVRLDDYFIDAFEVTNREFKEFVDAGGYTKRELWKHPVSDGGGVLSWDEAMRRFTDRTGLPGPRGWTNQSYPDGTADHPVTDVTWYEAAAYAEFRGKQLPTVFQWEKAARDGDYTHLYWFVMPWGLSSSNARLDERANLLGTGTVPVGSLEFGMSPYGCFDMAGNVAEWCANPHPPGHTATGGSWKDPLYLFANYGAFPGLYSASTLGFRCVRAAPHATGDQGAAALDAAAEIPVYRPPSDERLEAMLRHYEYDDAPLDAAIEEVVETAAWRRERISYAGAGGRRAFAYLYLPKNVAPPVQVIHYVPTDGAYFGLTVPEEVEAHAAPLVKAGRAVFAVVLEGYRERPWPAGFTPPRRDSVAFRDMVVAWAVDHRRGLDYLSTRGDVDAGAIACYAVSGNTRKVTLVAVEPRYRSVVLLGAGLMTSWTDMIAEANGANFAASIRAPKLMINGRYDEAASFESEARPLFRLLREPKRMLVFDQGHIPPLEISVPAVNAWLDETMGPVRR